MDFFLGAAIVLIVFISSTAIEKSLKKIENQNENIIRLLEEIRDGK